MPLIGKYWLAPNLYHVPFYPGHTWAQVEPWCMVRVGIDDFAQKQGGGLLSIRLLPVGKEVEQGQHFGTVETVRSDAPVVPLIAPVSGKLAQRNEEVIKNPRLANEDPYGKGWIVVINATNLEQDLNQLVKGDQAVKWLKNFIKEVAKENINY